MQDTDLELFKQLKAGEIRYYELTQSLWLQKFVLIGGAIAFLATNASVVLRSAAAKADPSVFSLDPILAVALIPLLSMVLDLKIVEYSLHARIMSRFLAREFADATRAARWERVLWGDERSDDALLLLARNALNVLAAALPTAALTAAAAVIVSQSKYAAWQGLGWAALALYVCAMAGFTVLIVRAGAIRLRS